MLITKKRTAIVLFTCITVPTAYIIPEIFTQILADRHTDEKIDKQIDKARHNTPFHYRRR